MVHVIEIWVRLGNGGYLKGVGKGNINIQTYNGIKWQENHLSNVLHVPGLRYNLLSSGTTLDKGLKLESDKSMCKFIKGDNIIAIGERSREQKLFTMKFKVITPSNLHENGNKKEVEAATITESIDTWHQKLAHQNLTRVKQVLKDFNIKTNGEEHTFCDACAVGKIHRLPFPKSNTKTDRIGEIIHADVCGPMQVKTMRCSRYFLLLKDDFSHFRHIYFLAAKSDVYECLKEYITKTEKHCPRGIKILRTDNGLEFLNKEVGVLLKEYGIQHQRTVAYNPEQNGAAERENRTIVEAARTVLHATNFGLNFWAEAISNVVHVLNCSGTSTVQNLTPYELWHNRKPPIKDLHIFGEKVYIHVPKIKRQKLDDKGTPGLFLCYEENVKGFRIWNLTNKTVIIERNLIFTGKTESVNENIQEKEVLLY